MAPQKKFTGIPITEIANDKDKKKFFFLVTRKNGKVIRHEDVNFKKLEIKRKIIFDREEAKERKKFETKIPKEKIKVLKKSAGEGRGQKTTVVRSGNIELLQLRKKVILEAKIKGLSDIQIKDLISAEFEISLSHVSREISLIEDEIRNQAIVSHEEILLSHLTKYENLYAKFREEGADAYALKALRSKENVAGLHDQTVNIQVNNYMDSEFSINILSGEKQKRLKELLIKVKVT